MDRRSVLKNLGLAAGAAVTAPSILSILSSCTDDRTIWVPSYFSKKQGLVLTHVVDVIFPVSELPGAVEVNVPQLIDVMFRDVEYPENQEVYKKGMNQFIEVFESKSGKSIENASTEDVEVLFEYFFKANGKDKDAINAIRYSNPNELSGKALDEFYIYNFLLGTRDYTIFGYYSSEKVGKEVLNYDPIPGAYDPCISLESVGNKSWSLS
ncbi:gluconate 2-dehydrogenase subunit 3 family protein [Flavobacteriaceae bacterium]|nr:gluconate 2-dehydrogenase subunit 3 family protein [Flavobacteriaceae bacterium]